MHHMLRPSNSLDEHKDPFYGDIVLLDYPVHDNIGDLLIWKGSSGSY